MREFCCTVQLVLMKLRRALSGLRGEMAEFCRVTERNGAVCDGKID